MSILFYSEEEDNSKEETINNYRNLFFEYIQYFPNLSDSLKDMFLNCNASEDLAIDLVEDIISKTNEIVNKNYAQIKEKYPEITKEDAKIIASYTCESKNENFSPYKLLNKNLVSDNRKNGIKKIAKYFYIFNQTLRKLTKYYPNEKNKYLYRCISSKVNINYDVFNKKLIPYIVGKTKNFWGYTSTSPNIKMTYNFLGKKENIKIGTIFTLTGKIWGYDITLFNYY